MIETRTSAKIVVEGQIPIFLQEEYPNFGPFLKQYYESQEYFSSPLNIVKNIDQLLKVGTYTSEIINSNSTTISQFADLNDTTIYVENTSGWPERFGLFKVNDEIVTYTSIGSTFFDGCIRGFSGITTYSYLSNSNQLAFETTGIQTHAVGEKVENLSTLFLKEFLTKIKSQYAPGFENVYFPANLNQKNFILQSKDFYTTKGTPQANSILFKSAFGEDAETIKPQDYLIKPSATNFKVLKKFVVEPVTGNPLDLTGNTLFQEYDKNLGINTAYGSVSDVESHFYNGKNYYTLGLDFGYDRDLSVYGSVYGNFSIHPKTKIVGLAYSSLIVDSTVGFANSGYLSINGKTISYQNKTLNQFLNCSGITTESRGDDISASYVSYGFSGNNKIEVRITGVLENLNPINETQYYEKDDLVEIKSIGAIKEKNDSRFNSWIFNTSTKFEAISITYDGNYFVIETYDNHQLRINDTIEFVNKIDNSTISGQVEKISTDNKFLVSSSLNPNQTNLSQTYLIRRIVKTISSAIAKNEYLTDVQNVYDSNSDVIVASPSIPSYNISATNLSKSTTLSGFTTTSNLTINDHDFITGEQVYLSSDSNIISSKNFFVNKIDNNTIQLASSPSNIDNQIYETFSNYSSSNVVLFLQTLKNKNKQIDSQKIIRKINIPKTSSVEQTTIPNRRLGILVNGVEILNYKSNDVVYYGGLSGIDVLDGGKDYDVINPPILEIQDSTGVGATGTCAVSGSLKQIEIIDGGFDYLETPSIIISGGNGKNATAQAKLKNVKSVVYFNALGVSTSSGGYIDTSTDIIGFNTEHKFKNGEAIIYNSSNRTKIGIGSTSGDTTTQNYLQDNSSYYVSLIDEKTIKLYNNSQDAISKINPINITSAGDGVQKFESLSDRKIISSIVVTNSGSGYENKKRVVVSSGINTALDLVNIENHDFASGEFVTYSCTGTPISGLSTENNYQIIKIDNNNFRLCSAGIGTTSNQFNYETNQYVDLRSIGSGYHYFNYPTISVSIIGNIGIGTTNSYEKYNAVLQPIFRGNITSIQLTNTGSGYGSSNIINYNKQPSINLNSGRDAEVKPIVVDGKIKSIIVLNQGSGYNSSPSFKFYGGGGYAKLTPILQDGKLIAVNVTNGGVGFATDKTSVEVIANGNSVSLRANIQKWTINLAERYKGVFAKSKDDGLLVEGITEELEYVNLYAPRKLREILPSKNVDGSNNYQNTDLSFNNNELLSVYHSPIIGWAYDGNPIYGPYGYERYDGGNIKALKSGYEYRDQPNRPSFLDFPAGFFVEDYTFTNNGDLDIHNGRYCKTPDFPNGTYAYFATINSDVSGYDTAFDNYRRPIFPYLIGNSYYSKLNSYNLLASSNQNVVDISDGNYIRNTYPYRLNESHGEYEFIYQSNKIINQTAIIDFASSGKIEKIGIVSEGYNYSINDELIFDNTSSGGVGAAAKISEISESRISSINASTISLDNVVFNVLDSNGKIEGISTVPHNLKNTDTVNITGLSDQNFSGISGFKNITVNTNTLSLSVGLGTTGVTGITTFVYVYGNLDSSVLNPNDVLKITNPGVGTEKLLVLNADKVFSRIRVRREHDGTVGYAYSASTKAELYPRKFTFISGFVTDRSTTTNSIIYFNPQNSVAIGTAAVGAGTTISIVGMGDSTISKFVRIQSIYLPEHNLVTGQKLLYSNGGGTSLGVSTNSTNTSTLSDNSIVYVAKFTDDLIGISTTKIGINSTGGFSGVGSAGYLLYFTSIATGNKHNFTTQFDQITGKVQKNVATITCNQPHNLQIGDQISLVVNPGITTTVKIKYNPANRRLVVNPITFNGSGINTITDTFTLVDHNFSTGDKVIYSSSSPALPLISDQIYYVIKVDSNTIKLSPNYYQTTLKSPQIVSIASTGLDHEISSINPPLFATLKNNLKFDLSDSSLSDIDGGSRVQSFDFNIFTDSNLNNKFLTTEKESTFEVSKIGIIGVSNDASLILRVTENIPTKLYYGLTPLYGKTYLSKEKSEIINDTDIIGNNSLNVTISKFNGSYSVSGIGNTTISINLNSFPEKNTYNQFESSLKYTTKSLNATGSISKVKVIYSGYGYKSLPGITSISSQNGYGGILIPESNNIGNIVKTSIQNIGFEYSSDKSLKPIAQLPNRLFVEQLSSIDSIKVIDGGKNYSVAPGFVVIDSVTNQVIDEVILNPTIKGNKVVDVSIFKNTNRLYNSSPKIVSVNNVNGIGITNISYNSNTKEVTVTLATGFSTATSFPFSVGSKIFIEGVGIIPNSGNGYNSYNYNYQFFTLTGVTSAIGGSNGSLVYSLDKGAVGPGTFYPSGSYQNQGNAYGRVVPESYMPKFEVNLKRGEFSVGENVLVNNTSAGKITNWNSINKLLKISESTNEIKEGDIVLGESSKTFSVVKKKLTSYGDFNVGSSNIAKGISEDNVGKLNTFLQVIPDNDYYQNFSYSIKSPIEYEKWNQKVSNLTHTSGFKKFSDLQIESVSGFGLTAILPTQPDIETKVDFIEEIDFDCYENFDFVKENSKTIDGNLVSDQIIFDNQILLDYTEFVSNRVLKIDDFSDQFDDTPSIFNYTTVGTFDVTQYNSAQFYILIEDVRYFGEREIIIVNVTYDGANGYLTAYGRNETIMDLGDFSFRRSGSFGEILFYPRKYEYNSYNISNINAILANSGITGINSSSLGDVVSFASTSVAITSSITPTANTIVSISTNSYTSGKVLVSVSESNGDVQFGEVNFASNGSNVYYEFLGEIDSGDLTPAFGSGVVGTIGVTTTTNNVLITFTPNPSLTVDVKALTILMGNTTKTGVGTTVLYKGELSSYYVSIASSTSPIETPVAGFSSDTHDAAHYYVQVNDTTNNRIQFSEVMLVNDSEYNPSISEYAIINSHNTLGTIGAAKSIGDTYLTFTPNSNINAQVRVFQKTLQLSPKQDPVEVDLTSAIIRSDTTSLSYEATILSVKRDFNLTHRSSPIFYKEIDGSSSNVVNISGDSIKIQNHFFVTGEKIDYSVTTGSTRIGIATTSVTGIGTTSLLPTSLYAVKIDENTIKFAETAQKALKSTPDVFNLSSVGIGNSHQFASNYKSNTKALISIDNVIQNPVVSTAKTTYITQNTNDINTTSVIYFNNTDGFYTKDLIKIENEFLVITDIGIGGTNIVACRREWLGSVSAAHSTGAIVTKYAGNYNIVNDSIYFVDAPHGDASHPVNDQQFSSFEGRIFLRNAPVGSSNTAYYENNIFDDISSQFNGTRNSFALKSSGNDVTGIVSTNSVSAGILLINNIFQKPKYPATGIAQTFTYEVTENAGISSVIFSGNPVGLTTNNIVGAMKFDINSASLPRGGIIVSLGSTQGFGYQPLVAAGGTVTVSAAGTIQSISIGNSGSGYRPGIQTSIVVSVATSTGKIAIGTASAYNGNIVAIAITNPGTGYTSTNPPKVTIDSPLNYENIPLVYDSTNVGVGTEATVDITVGYGNSIIEFNLSNSGYGYSVGNVLIVNVGGSTGIPTDSTVSFRPFRLTVNEVFFDQFNAWYPGQFVVLDDFNSEFDGYKKIFALKENGVPSNFQVSSGSPVILDENLLVFINDILQIPAESYIFDGGSFIEFTEAPKVEDTVKILFFKGSGVDIRDVHVIPTIKVGDNLTIKDNLQQRKNDYTETSRIVTSLQNIDSVYTTQYNGSGIATDSTITRVVEWCKQKNDIILDQRVVSKNRPELIANVYPNTTIIRPVGVGSTSIFVQNTRPLFNYTPEILGGGYQNITIVSQNPKSGCIATSVVSTAGTISQILVLNGGLGFSTSPSVSISPPTSGVTAIATCIISGVGTISQITITTAGSGYTSTNPPKVLIESEVFTIDTLTGVSYEGDDGIITGIGTTSIVGVSTGLTFDFYLPQDSLFRNSSYVGSAQTISGIQTGYYFMVYESTIGNGVTSINDNGSILGIGTSYLNNVYQAASIQNVKSNAVGIGSTTDIIRVTVSVKSYNGLSGIGNSQYFAKYSWGRLYNFSRSSSPKQFDIQILDGVTGLSTAPLIIRSTPMRSLYTS